MDTHGTATGQQLAEVGVGLHHHEIIAASECKHNVVRCGTQTDVLPVNRMMASRLQKTDPRR